MYLDFGSGFFSKHRSPPRLPPKKEIKDVVVVGAGGVGTHLLLPLCRYLDSLNWKGSLTILDGDTYSESNAARQHFRQPGSNKAEASAAFLKEFFPTRFIEGRGQFLSPDNAFLLVREGDIVFSCVDNHATRKTLSDHCGTLKDCLLISGGNEFSDGTVQVYIRRNGVDKTPPLTHLHPEIETPQDRSPHEMGCEELAREGEPQLIFANLAVASLMLNAFWLATRQNAQNAPVYSEQFFDLETGRVRPVLRNPPKNQP